MQRSKKLMYVPGMISLVMLPLLINFHIQRYTKHYKQHVITISVQDHRGDHYEEQPPFSSPMDGIWMFREHDLGSRPIDYHKLLTFSQHAELPDNRKNTYINEFYPFRFAKGTLFVVGICYLVLLYFAMRRS